LTDLVNQAKEKFGFPVKVQDRLAGGLGEFFSGEKSGGGFLRFLDKSSSADEDSGVSNLLGQEEYGGQILTKAKSNTGPSRFSQHVKTFYGTHWFLSNLLSGLLIVAVNTPALAGGPVHGARAAGMGTAFVAVADDPSAILYNPAGIAQIKGNNIYAGNSILIPFTSYKDPLGNKEDTEFQVFFPPHFFQTFNLKQKDFVFGVGFYSPFGVGGRKWSGTGLVRYFSTESWIATFTVNPTVAYQLTPSVSIAAGVDYMKAFNNADRAIDQSLVGSGDGLLKIEADGDGWGYNLGVLFKLSDRFRIGLAYRSSISVDFDGDLSLSSIAPALLPLFGGSSFITEWSSFSEATLDIQQEVFAAGLVDTTTQLGWDDSLQMKIGMEYNINQQITLRCGYAYIPSPVPDNTIEPGNPDATSHNLSIGAGYSRGKWTADFYYNAGIFEKRKVDNNLIKGEFDNFTNFFGLSIGYRFR
jgi:long-chain fatty acid transport protein